jgi:CDP-paratose 2-epimerase
MRRALITGSSGLIGSEAVLRLDELGWDVHGVDNNMRRDFFGPDGDTTWNVERLKRLTRQFTHHDLDVRARRAMAEVVKASRPHMIFHCAAQPSHDLAKDRPFDDFDINAGGTLALLEAARHHCPESPFVFMSTNKVYGDAPNELPLRETPTRWDYARLEDREGVDESCRVDSSTHSLFGASKLSADVLVQEYGRYFGMPTVCFRGGCLTGPNHSGAELHGFLAYLARAVHEGRTYRIFGYKGKQVRDNIHAHDVCSAALAFHDAPRVAAVYNLGGGRANSVSILEAIDQFQGLLNKKLPVRYEDQPRVGDHICYITNLKRFKTDYPKWTITRWLPSIMEELAKSVHRTTPC